MLSYLDAATGSMIVSAVAGGAAGLSVAGRMGMKRIKDKFSRSSDADVIADTADATDLPDVDTGLDGQLADNAELVDSATIEAPNRQ